jgi:hypothetical protein
MCGSATSDDIAKARKLDAAQLAAGIDTMPEGIAAAGGDLAKFALQQKLVDGLKTREEVEDLLADRGVADEDADGGFRSINLGRLPVPASIPVVRRWTRVRRWRWWWRRARLPAATCRRAAWAVNRPRPCCARRATTRM